MSWHTPPPPLSPRKPTKIQQQSWDEVPKINLYDPSRSEDSGVSMSLPGTSSMKKSTKKIGYQKCCIPNAKHQMSDPGSYHTSNSLKSPKSPGSQVFEFELTSSPDSNLPRSPLRPSSRQHYFEESSDSAPAIMTSQRRNSKFEFNAISPKIEHKSTKKFEYLSNSSNGDKFHKELDLEMVELYSNVNKTTSDDDGSNMSSSTSNFLEGNVVFAKCTPKKNRSFKKRHYNVSPDGVSSLDEYTTTITYETNTLSGGRRMSITISDMAADTCSEISSEPVMITESLETSSFTTQSSSSRTTAGSPLPSPTSTTHSLTSTATCDSKQSQANRPNSLYQKIIGEEPEDLILSQENLHIDLQKRRHAINITNNPGYKALHNSHSTLDRTCSDSAVSLKHRKSTSDLTANDENHHEGNAYVSKHRRRGSSKGGLAYLMEKRDSRRGSRDSAVSHQSNISNEDIGPLANFQQTQRGRQRRTSNFLELPVADHIRPRVCSLPDRPYTPYNPRVSDDLYRLRTFSISKGTVVNCGDSIISRRSRSNTSVNSTTSRLSERSPFDGSCCGGYTGGDDTSSDSEPPPAPRYRIVLLGDAATGKTALVNQFMTSEYMHTYDASLDDEFGEKTVSILLDGEESELVFIDHPSHEMSVENSLSTYEPHACIVVYSIVQRSSFRCAEEIINYLWRENITKEKAVILVGNKADLARSRVIPTSEGKQLAASREMKFIETSSGIQHNVDELLVGILKQIRLKESREKKQSSTKMKNSKTQMSLHMAKEILQKICFNQLDITKSKSCENLHVL